MVHIDNISHILTHGITHISSINSNVNYRSIGDANLITKRTKVHTPSGEPLSEYIPFYFGVLMPMLYVMQGGYNHVTSLASPREVIYCVSNIQKIIALNLEFIFTNGHAVNSFSKFFTIDDIINIKELLDFNAIRCKYWKNDDDLDLKRRKEAEFLIKGDIPLQAITGYIVYDNIAKYRLIALGVVSEKIIVKPEFYF
jgi:ssDNA thymidine ADP-ribosyltransferase, DarT